jgi:hypothetical protein
VTRTGVRLADLSPACSSRTRDASFGWTSRTRSPAATSCWASSRPTPAAPSTAQVRSGHAAAHSASFPACAADARTRISPSGSSAGPITTAVCDPLCGSTPIITAVIARSKSFVREWRTWRACLITDLLALAPLSSHATARTGRLAPRSKARPHAVGRRFGSQPVGPHERYGTTAAPSETIRNHAPLAWRCRGMRKLGPSRRWSVRIAGGRGFAVTGVVAGGVEGAQLCWVRRPSSPSAYGPFEAVN